MEYLRQYAKANGITVVEVEEEEDNLYGAGPEDHIVTAGCYGDMCVATHTIFLTMNDINAVRDLDLCLVL